MISGEEKSMHRPRDNTGTVNLVSGMSIDGHALDKTQMMMMKLSILLSRAITIWGEGGNVVP